MHELIITFFQENNAESIRTTITESMSTTEGIDDLLDFIDKLEKHAGNLLKLKGLGGVLTEV